MGKFCTHCGRPLQEGEVCTCQEVNVQQTVENQMPPVQQQAQPVQQQVPPVQQQAQPVQQVPPVQQQVPPVQPQGSSNAQATKELANQVKGNFLQLLKKPVTVGKKIVEEADIKIAVIFLVLQAIASSLFGLAVGSKVNDLISTVGGLTGGFDFGISAAVVGMLKVSYGKIFVVTLLLSLVFSGVYALLLWLAHMAIRCKTSFQKMVSVAAIRSAVMVPLILVSLLLFELNVGMGFCLLIVGNIWGFITTTVVMTEFIPEEKKDIFPLAVSIAILLFIAIVTLVMGKEWTLYLPEAVKTAVDTISGYISDPSKILGDLLESVF